MAKYPSSIFDPRPKENRLGVEFNPAKKTVLFAEDISSIDEEIVAIETILGLNPQGEHETVGDYLQALESVISSIPDSFLDLVDTPSSFEGMGGKSLVVKDDESGIEFGDPSAGGEDHIFLTTSKGGYIVRNVPKVEIYDDYIILYEKQMSCLHIYNKDTLTIKSNKYFTDQADVLFTVSDSYIFAFNLSNLMMYVYNRSTCSEIKSYPLNINVPLAMCATDDFVYFRDADTNKIFKINYVDNSVSALTTFAVSSTASKILQDDNYLYVLSSTNSKVDKINKTTGAKTLSFSLMQGSVFDFCISSDKVYITDSVSKDVSVYLKTEGSFPYSFITVDEIKTLVRYSNNYLVVFLPSRKKYVLIDTNEEIVLADSCLIFGDNILIDFYFPDIVFLPTPLGRFITHKIKNVKVS